jgi:hypothetical protein
VIEGDEALGVAPQHVSLVAVVGPEIEHVPEEAAPEIRLA